ncbi:unnamed protein product [Spirodela intermedia]|uniref:Uncharacterized protein n=2 Tax=Spirodela intermedia TaxID=51605 RepID=A0A7I8JMD4_SPIIN|nr:unnamed protein product [Spirodela intermedia]CAA6671289.1 unnamed protein product [Spirodela intermedia]CAA7408381.1 unnamed protein product [Spirodela intermedia]
MTYRRYGMSGTSPISMGANPKMRGPGSLPVWYKYQN